MNELMILFIIGGIITIFNSLYWIFASACYLAYRKIFNGKMKYGKYLMVKFGM